MRKRVCNKFVLNAAITQISLIVLMIFAVGFLMAQTLPSVSAAPSSTLVGTTTSGFKDSATIKTTSGYPVDLNNLKTVQGADGTWTTTGTDPSGATWTTTDQKTWTSPGGSSGSSSGGGIEGAIGDIYKGNAVGGGVGGSLVAGAAWAVTAYFAVKMIAGLFGADEGLTNALANSAAAGAGVYGILQSSYMQQQFWGADSFAGSLVRHPYLTAIIVAAVVFVLTYKKDSYEMVNYKCQPYEPPLGGSQCEQCNKDPFRPCSEYRCKSLGQACDLVNKNTVNEQCVWVSKFDVNSPKITPWVEPLTKGYKYVTDTSIRPPALGVKIVNNDKGCVQAFTALKFGITTNEPAQCKLDFINPTTNRNSTNGNSFDNLQYYFGGSSYYEYNHSQSMRLPAPDSNTTDTSPLLRNDGSYSLYVMCRDANGNVNEDVYSISFCVDASADTTPPVVESTSIISGSPVSYNIDHVPIQVYVNEPAQCKWSSQDKTYDEMENEFECVTDSSQVNSKLLYTCAGNLSGVENMKENKYYFRCRDQPTKAESERNTMATSYEYSLRGTRQLTIKSVGPNETVTGSTEAVKVDLTVETDFGEGLNNDQGKATCYFSQTGLRDSYIEMFSTNSYKHSQQLTLTSGNYKYYFRCVDAGGNSAEATTEFGVYVDKQEPMVTRAYKDIDALKIVTDEDAQCAYSTSNCQYNFADGSKLIYSNPSILTNHFVKWDNLLTYYIKCKDAYGNEPSPNQCSLIASPSQLTAKETNE